MDKFDGRAVLITGGGSGIGLACARALLDAGAQVVLAGRSKDRLAAAQSELDAADRVLTVPADVASTDSLDSLIEQVRERFGGLYGVFANAGIAHASLAADVTETDFDQVVGTNFRGTFFTVQKALTLVEDGGAVVLNSSWLVHRGASMGVLYAASKAAVLSLARSLAPDLAARGIRINAITPGHVATEMLDTVTGGNDDIREFFRGQVASGRIGLPQEIAQAALFLLSPQSSYITGQELIVDGGLINSIPN
jgi:NAD(P)-dependent dehydrogenase (short-subunit alcohol dehydrogenase family)